MQTYWEDMKEGSEAWRDILKIGLLDRTNLCCCV